MREIHSVAVAPNGTIYAAAMTGERSISPATPAAPAATTGNQPTTVTVTVNAAGAAGAAEPQDIQVVEPLDAVSTDTPRSQTRRSGSEANAQSAVLEISAGWRREYDVALAR